MIRPVLRTLAAAGAFLVSLDSLVNIAFPAMAAAFGTPPERMRWVIIAYVLTYALMSLVGGAAGDRFGHGRVFAAGLALSAVGFIVCGTAPTFGWLLAGRVVQGFAGGLVYGTTPALVTLEADPAGRGRALGYLNGAIALAFLAQAGIFAVWLLAPFYLLERRGFAAPMGGALFMLMPLGTAVGAPPAGRVADRLGPWAPMTAGLALEALGLAVMAGAGPTTPVVVLALALFTAGLGVGVFQAPNMTALMAEFPPGQQGAAGGFAFLARTLGTSAGVALLAEIFAWRRLTAGFDAAFQLAFTVAAGLVGFAALAAAARSNQRR